MEERLQKHMARCGIGSRRRCEELIAGGLVAVNGKTVSEPGVKVFPGRDRVEVEGRPIAVERMVYLAQYKVKGVTTTASDDLGRKTVMDYISGMRERVYPVGRLDRDTEGLLLFTNDGNLAHYLTHPAFGVKKTYRVTMEGRIDAAVLSELRTKGIRLGSTLVKPSGVKLVRYDHDSSIVMISVAEGINREVRRVFSALGHEVKRLLRIQVGCITLEGMKRGVTRHLTNREVAAIKTVMAGSSLGEIASDAPAGGVRKVIGQRFHPRRRAGTPRLGKPDPALFAAKKNLDTIRGGEEKKGKNRNRKRGMAMGGGARSGNQPAHPLRASRLRGRRGK